VQWERLVLHWDGSTWQIVPSPGLSSSLTALLSVSSISATDVWAVGEYYNENAALLTLAQHWDGKSWQVFATPNPAGFDVGARNVFTSVASVPGTGVWAVGYYEVTVHVVTNNDRLLLPCRKFHPNTHTYRNSYSDVYCNAEYDTQPECNRDRNAHTKSYGNRNGDSDADFNNNTKTDPNAGNCPYTETSADTSPSSYPMSTLRSG